MCVGYGGTKATLFGLLSMRKQAVRQRTAKDCSETIALRERFSALRDHGDTLRIGRLDWRECADGYDMRVRIYLGEIETPLIRAELIADPQGQSQSQSFRLTLDEAIVGATNGYVYTARLPNNLDRDDFSVRVTVDCTGMLLPTEAPFITSER